MTTAHSTDSPGSPAAPTPSSPATSQPDSHGKFSLSEDWTATIAGLVLLIACLAGIVPNIGEWF
ncbi:hypothetical protein [Corynebacterium sp.]|uniref:hypothetical protein n=1 Tax=Corynebacterium sp. TaxID=1720 RepID=UPI0037350301